MCTSSVLAKSEKRTADTFNPSAVYRQTAATNIFALEGIRKNCYYQEKEPFHAYLLIPNYLLISAAFQTNEDLSLRDLKIIQDKKSANYPGYVLETKKVLPPKYVNVSSLPPNDVNIEIKEHHPNRFLCLLVPFTLVADIVTFPVQVFMLDKASSGAGP